MAFLFERKREREREIASLIDSREQTSKVFQAGLTDDVGQSDEEIWLSR